MDENIAPVTTTVTSVSIFKNETIVSKFQELLGKKANSFLTSVMGIVSQNDLLKKADPNSVYLSAMVSATLDLPINPNLGFAYIIPFNCKEKDENGKDIWKTKAQFQLGYKGFIQLALRSGQFKTISATPVYEGQLVEENPLTGFIFDWKGKSSDKIIGYASYFSLINGFEKTFYMNVEELKKHGLKFSQTFKKGYGLWKDDFDNMAQKTVIKLLLSKYAPLSVEMQKAVIADQGIIQDENLDNIEYADQEEILSIDLSDKLKEINLIPNSNENV